MTSNTAFRLRRAFSNPAWICFVWFGMTAGISMLATPVRFASETLARDVKFEVASLVFTALNKAELVALVLFLIVIRVSGAAARWWAVAGLLVLIVMAQSVFLLPELAARADMIVSGIEPPPSYVHGAYSTLELTKLAILFVSGMVALGWERQSNQVPNARG